MDLSCFDEYPSDVSGDFDSDSDDDFVPENNEPNSEDEYDSDDSVQQETRQSAIVDPNILLLSKDKKIQYFKEPIEFNRSNRNLSTSFATRQGPTVYAVAQCTSILTTFLLFIEPIQQTVLEMTNLYGLRRYKDDWLPIDMVELHAFFGLLILASVYRSNGECVTELWNDKHGRPILPSTMSLKRFKLVHSCLRFDDNEIRQRDKLAPIRSIFDKWVQRLKVLYCVGDFVTVDEQLLPFHGRSPFTQYIPSKPAKYGLKLWIATDAETWYAYNLQVYIGRDRNCAPEVNQGERVVLEMTEGLNGRNVTCDNFFTSHQLVKKLKQRQMTMVGTIRKNRKEIPPSLVDMKRKAIHHTVAVFDHNLRACMLSYVPKKRRFVTLLSTYHSTVEIDPNDPQKKPEVIKFYNRTKGGVDVLDKLVATYRCKRKVNRWPVAFFCNMIDISACNAFIIYTAMNPGWNIHKKNIRRRLFLVELRQSLCTPYIQQRKRLPRNPNALAVVNSIRNPDLPSTSIAAQHIPPQVGSLTLTHQPVTKKRARCHMCPYLSNANNHATRCDLCTKSICPAHYYKLCEKCAHQRRLN